ncbi:hypothetical protein MBOURGENBZM_16000 [Methanoculleus bourgensis]|nr:hypothetical protein MBOURGENBZM_16000 [Methanoculleus bourgensis]
MLFMRYRALLICLLVLALLSAGCTSPENLPSTTSQKKTTPTPTPTPGYGSVMISSDPWGADIYLDGELKGTAPLTLTNVPTGKHNLLVTMDGYKESNSTITITADKGLTVKKSLKEGKPDIYVNIAGTQMVQQGIDPLMEITGTVFNEGEKTAYDFKLIIEMTPKDSRDKDLKVTKIKNMGALKPGDEVRYVEHIKLRRNIDYRGTIKCEYMSEGKLMKGATKSF